MKIYKKNDTLFIHWAHKDGKFILFVGCAHIDNPHTDLKLLKRILDYAISINAVIVLLGDIIDVMDARNDPRRSYGSIRKEYNCKETKTGSYLNDVLMEITEFLKPYANNIALILRGNHELSAHKNLDIDLMSIIVNDLQRESNSEIMLAGWESFIRVIIDKSTGNNAGTVSGNILVKHGEALGKVTKGALSFDRLSAKYSGFDVFAFAHGHVMLHHDTKVCEIDIAGNERFRDVTFLQAPSFKPSWESKDKTGWWHTNNMGARATGCWLTEFDIRRNGTTYDLVTDSRFLK